MEAIGQKRAGDLAERGANLVQLSDPSAEVRSSLT